MFAVARQSPGPIACSVEGLKVSLAAATAKLTQMDELAARRATAVHLGRPAFTQTANRTTTIPAILPDSQQSTTVQAYRQLRTINRTHSSLSILVQTRFRE